MPYDRHVLIAVDTSEHSVMNFRFMMHNIVFDKEKDLLTICTVITPHSNPVNNKKHLDQGNELLEKFVKEAVKCHFKNVEPYLTSNEEPQKAIVDAAKNLEADLLVTGARGLSGIKHFFVGSVSQYVVTHAHCPVIIVRPKDINALEDQRNKQKVLEQY